jgi:proline racemase
MNTTHVNGASAAVIAEGVRQHTVNRQAYKLMKDTETLLRNQLNLNFRGKDFGDGMIH